MSAIGDAINKCPLCGADKVREKGKTEVACDGCGSVFSLVPDPRLATLKMTVKKTSLKGWQSGSTLLTIPNMEVVRQSASAGHAKHA